MSTTIIRHCDRCKKEISVERHAQIWVVQILVATESDYTSQHSSALRLYEKTNPLRQEWCRQCADALNLIGLRWTPPADNPAAEPPTFEDKLRDIIREEVESIIDDKR